MTICMARTPHRLSLVWWGTDVKDYYNQYWGISINFAINMFSSCLMRDNPYGWIIIKSKDLWSIYSSLDIDPKKITWEPFNLARVVYEKILKITWKDWISFYMETDSVVPVWSWLWWSSSMITSILSAFLNFVWKDISKEELRNMAYEIEREDLWIKWWIQDHLCAVYWWFNVYYLSNKGIDIKPLEVKSLTDGLVLVYTWISRDWWITMDQQIKKVQSWSKDKIESLNKIKNSALSFLELIKDNNHDKIHETINNSWMHKIENMDPVKKQVILDIYNYWLKMWAYSWRILWAWNWWFMVFFSDIDKKIDIGSSIALKFPQSRVYYPIFEKDWSKVI
jgi:galactokinase/mevalonate kinase-like predicted kinase